MPQDAARSREAAALEHSGTEMLRAGRLDEAEALFRQALALDPRAHRSLAKLALVLSHRNRLTDAFQTLSRAVDLAPRDVGLHLQMGALLTKGSRGEEAQRAYRHALRLDPENGQAWSGVLAAARRALDWDAEDEAFQHLRDGIARGTSLMPPVDAMLHPFTMEELRRNAERYARLRFARDRYAPAPAVAGARSGPLRVGFMSPDFRRHATWHLAGEIFPALDPTRIESIAYSIGPDDDSEERREAASGFRAFRDLRQAGDDQAAATVAADKLDLLVDLGGYIHWSRPNLLARRPAPVQAAWLGFPGTMGAPFVDFLIADAVVAPEDHDAWFTERVVRVPCYQANRALRPISAPMGKLEAGLPPDRPAIAAFNNHRKWDRASMALLFRLLARVPEAVLWMEPAPEQLRAKLAAHAERHHVDGSRIVFAERRPWREHVARLTAADVFVDALVWGAHTTASDALRAGLPVFTVLGPTFQSRVAASLLTILGWTHGICRTSEEMEERVVSLIASSDRLRAAKVEIARLAQGSALFDPARHARALEQALVFMVEEAAVRPPR